MKKNKLIFSDFYQGLDEKINYLDVGARGDISAPWNYFDNSKIKIIGFEPDEIEAKRLSKLYPDRTYYPYALWGSQAERPFYLYQWESTSSMYLPNKVLNENYQSQHWVGRHPKDQFDMKCVRLDEILDNGDTPDFIKLDTQGSEYEILSGACETLIKGNPLVLSETWCNEIYKGAPLAYKIMGLMDDLGYAIFDLSVAASWRYRSIRMKKIYSRASLVGFDLLFIKKPDKVKFDSPNKIIKFAGLCELFGFRDYAAFILEGSSMNKDPLVRDALEVLYGNNSVECSLFHRARMKLHRFVNKDEFPWPSLHY